MKKQVLMMSICALLSSCGGDEGDDPAPPADDGLIDVIVYVYAPDGFEDAKRNIAAMTPDGSRKKVLYAQGQGQLVSRAALSPDGTRIVSGDYDLKMLDLATGGTTMLKAKTDGDFYADEAVWSPDGGKILYVNWAGSAAKLETIKPDGTDRTAITLEAEHDLARPNYTPNGQKIVATDFSKKYIAVFPASGAGGTKIIQVAGEDMVDCAHPVSDSRILFFKNPSGGNLSLWSGGIDGSDQVQLCFFVPEFDKADHLSANKDGTMIAYCLIEDWTGEHIPTLVVSPLTGNTLGAPIFSQTDINGVRFRFGRIKKTIFDAAPDL